MTFLQIIFLIVCGIGTLNSFLLGFYFLFNKKGHKKLNILLALFIFTYAVRVSKSIWLLFFSSIHPAYEIIWYVCFAAGPFILASYLIILADKASILKKQIRYSLPLLTVFISLIALSINDEMALFTVLMILYPAVLLYSVYILSSDNNIFKKIGTELKRWLILLIVFSSAIWVLYLTVYIHNHNIFLMEAVLFSIFIYTLVFLEIRYSIISKIHREKTAPFAPDENIHNRLLFLVEVDKIYLDPNLSLPKLSKLLNTSPHYLSKLINESYSVNFNDFINKFRVEEAKKRLTDISSGNPKISAIANDCGFNSISVFNAAFKKFTQKTPSGYQEQFIIPSK